MKDFPSFVANFSGRVEERLRQYDNGQLRFSDVVLEISTIPKLIPTDVGGRTQIQKSGWAIGDASVDDIRVIKLSVIQTDLDGGLCFRRALILGLANSSKDKRYRSAT